MSWEDDRKQFFLLAQEAEMVEDLANFAKAFGRFPSASITLADGRSASYRIPSNVNMSPLKDQVKPTPLSPITANHNKKHSTSPSSRYAKARAK